MGEPLQGGRLAAQAIAAAGVDVLFTLSGGHVMPIYEGCRHEGVRVVDCGTSSPPRTRPRRGDGSGARAAWRSSPRGRESQAR